MGRRRAFLIGNQIFRPDSGLAPLRGPCNDVDALARVLEAPDRGNFEARCFKDQGSDVIVTEIEEALDEAGTSDLILLFYAGHGMLDRSGRLCLATADTRGVALLATSIPTALLRDMVETADCGTVVLLLDCCFSGQAGVEFTRGNVASQIALMGETSGLYVLTASARAQTAKEAEAEEDGLTMGRFTAAIVRGIESGDADCNKDGFVSINDLNSYLRTTVRGQTPEFSARETSGDPVIATLRPPEPPEHRRRRRLGEWLFAGEIPDELYQSLVDAAEGHAELRVVTVVRRLLDREETTAAALVGAWHGAFAPIRDVGRRATDGGTSAATGNQTANTKFEPTSPSETIGVRASATASPEPGSKAAVLSRPKIRLRWEFVIAFGVAMVSGLVFAIINDNVMSYRRAPLPVFLTTAFINAMATLAVIAGARGNLQRRLGKSTVPSTRLLAEAYVSFGLGIFLVAWFICSMIAINTQ